MPKFENSCNVVHCDKKLSKSELIRAIRFNIAAEYEAIQLYQQVVESTDNEFVKTVLTDIANEEKEHAGELLKVLTELDKEESEFYKKGAKEVEELKKETNIKES
jgi:rubrerythrin